jgi:hypothetical protein
VLGRIALIEDAAPHLTTLSDLQTFIHDVPIREIIFCQGKLSFAEIINLVTKMEFDVRMRIHANCSASIVGYDSSKSAGTTVSIERYATDKPTARRYKRLLDFGVSCLLLLGFPIHMFYISNPAKLFRNIWLVIAGKKSWIGYSSYYHKGLPTIREGIIGTNALPVQKQTHLEEGLLMLDQLYAREYSTNRDLSVISKGYKWLGT